MAGGSDDKCHLHQFLEPIKPSQIFVKTGLFDHALRLLATTAPDEGWALLASEPIRIRTQGSALSRVLPTPQSTPESPLTRQADPGGTRGGLPSGGRLSHQDGRNDLLPPLRGRRSFVAGAVRRACLHRRAISVRPARRFLQRDGSEWARG
jgi:hypothetical protein